MAITPNKYFVNAFGEAGDLVAIPDVVQSGGSISYAQGFGPLYALQLGVDPNALPIPRASSNQLYNDITKALQQYQQWGTPNWITSAQNLGTPFPYSAWAYALYDDGSGSGPLPYQSNVNNNTNVPSISGVVQPGWTLLTTTGVDTGAVLPFARTSAPAGYLPLDGTISGNVVSRTTYANLYAAIGTTWGLGDGTTTFGIPYMARQTFMGSGGSSSGTPFGVAGTTVASTGGQESHIQTDGELAIHNHPGSSYQVPISATPPAALPVVAGPLTGSVATQPNTVNVAPDGSGTPFNVVQPSTVFLMCIKT